jgi:hypothetical protein
MDDSTYGTSDIFTPQSLSNLDKDRFGGYKRSLDFYDGNQWTERSRNRQLVFNYARIAIDKLTSYLIAGSQLRLRFTGGKRAGNAARSKGRAAHLSCLSR